MTNVMYIVSVLAVICLVVIKAMPKLNINDPENFKYFTREDWGAVPATDLRPINQPVPYVVIHHTYKPDACNTTNQCFESMRSMQAYHMGMGWGDIGYNFCLGSDGGVYEGRGWDIVGIHAGRANNFSVGICLIGDWRVSVPPKAMLDATQNLIAAGVDNGSLSPEYKLVGHKQIMATDCPGNALMNIISTWEHFTNELVDFARNI